MPKLVLRAQALAGCTRMVPDHALRAYGLPLLLAAATACCSYCLLLLPLLSLCADSGAWMVWVVRVFVDLLSMMVPLL